MSLTDPPKKRVRLAPAVRKQMILDAALIEFGNHGFDRASLAQIARRAGLSSQAGLYAHFKSKEEILETLLNDILVPRPPKREEGDDATYADLEALIDSSYAIAADPKAQAVMRILIAERVRFPQLTERWARSLLPHQAYRQELADALTAQGKIENNALSRHAHLLWSPVAYALLAHLLLGENEVLLGEEILGLREAHREAMRELVAIPPNRLLKNRCLSENPQR